jgi:hypothetical protein
MRIQRTSPRRNTNLLLFSDLPLSNAQPRLRLLAEFQQPVDLGVRVLDELGEQSKSGLRVRRQISEEGDEKAEDVLRVLSGGSPGFFGVL